MPPLKKLRRSWYAAKAIQFFGTQDAHAALRCVEAMRVLAPLSAAERMWSYYPLVLVNRYDEAFKIIDEVCRETDDRDDVDSQFVNLCARALRADYESAEPLRDQLLRQASFLKPKGYIKMWSQFYS